ncbi:keratin-associated protein 4-9 [Anabrus simplex]|uniref:keratin-associated protein 4-9 n=1 Tax=Anabrus simplex TaxID=316456 RepID=UPI0035A2C0F2
MKILLFLAVLQLSFLLNITEAGCSNGKCGKYELEDEDCTECVPACDCESQNCKACPGSDSCCQTCCDRKRCYGSRCNYHCDCRKLTCSDCRNGQNDCCDSCCKCKPAKCNRGCDNGGSCADIDCSSCSLDSSCCKSCCNANKSLPIVQPSTCCGPNITLPNITIIINQSPIYINNTTPSVNVNNQCGNLSAVQGNGTHVVYMYANSTMCPNRTCCRIPWRRPCIPIHTPPYYYCPPSQPLFQCGISCFNPPPLQAPCFPSGVWPYYQCPTAGCFGYSCYQQKSMACFPVPQWPYYQCPPGMPSGGGVTYGTPGYTVQTPAGSSPFIPIPLGGGAPQTEGPMNMPFTW